MTPARLSPSALGAWNAAVAEAGDLLDYTAGDEGAANFEKEDADGIETAWFAPNDIPGPMMRLDSLVESWVGELERWNEASTSSDLLRVRKG